MQQMMADKSYRIQVIRGLAILAVVMIHNTPAGVAQVWCRPFINYSVGMFLFLSGMLSSAERWQSKKRIKKVIIPYIIWTLVYVIMNNVNNPVNIPTSFVKNLLTAGAAATLYYVFVYCELTLLIPSIDKLARSRYKWIGFIISPLEIIVMRLLPFVTGYEMNKYVKIIMKLSCLGWFIYYYIGYLLGNGLLRIKLPISKIILMWVISIILQIAEGFWYFSMGAENYGTQLKLSAILTGVLVAFLGYRYLNNKTAPTPALLHTLGDYSFGIFFVHLAIMNVLEHLPYYNQIVVYPLNALIVTSASLICVIIGKKLIGKYSIYLAL